MSFRKRQGQQRRTGNGDGRKGGETVELTSSRLSVPTGNEGEGAAGDIRPTEGDREPENPGRRK